MIPPDSSAMSSSIPPSLYEYCQPTLLTEWSDDLLAHSFDTRFIYLDAAQSELLSRGPLWRGPVWGYADPVASALIEKLEPAFEAFGGEAFVRTHWRSGKDSSLSQQRRGRFPSPWLAMSSLRESRRFQEDVAMLASIRMLPILVVRRWASIEPWAEFRCFIRDRRLIGISHLRNQPSLPPAVRARAGVLHRLIAEYCQTWSNLLPRESVVADVVAPGWDGRALDDAAPPRLVLSELNPWHGMTDAGWFDWRRPQDFDGSLRCN